MFSCDPALLFACSVEKPVRYYHLIQCCLKSPAHLLLQNRWISIKLSKNSHVIHSNHPPACKDGKHLHFKQRKKKKKEIQNEIADGTMEAECSHQTDANQPKLEFSKQNTSGERRVTFRGAAMPINQFTPCCNDCHFQRRLFKL